jgi:ferrous iron transport protein B
MATDNNIDTNNPILKSAVALRWQIGEQMHDQVMEALYSDAQLIASRATSMKGTSKRFSLDRFLDRTLTSKATGIPMMLLLLVIVFWLTIQGANIPSAYLSYLLIDTLLPLLKEFGIAISLPSWLISFVVDGMYLAGAWVVSVMLPPMAIFFPLFTLLEDFGYLPRIAFNLDYFFRKAGAHGKQSLTMVMGYGCNAAGVIATRIIDSPRERLIAIITNNFAICNGRWPTQILMASIFIGILVKPSLAAMVSALSVIVVVLIGVFFTFIVSWSLSKTMLRGEPSTFSLELPPYRPPRILQTLYTSLIDRTLIVLWRAVVWAVPSGALIWLVSNISIGSSTIAEHLISGLNPLGFLIGLNGIILLAYIIAIPANEIVIPTVLMLTALTMAGSYTGAGAGVIFQLSSDAETSALLHSAGWTSLTGINLMLFSLLHNPCSTTIHTIYKETGSMKWTSIATLLPLSLAFSICFFVAQFWRMMG